MIALLPLSEDSSVGLLRNMFLRNRLAVAGCVEVHVVGPSESRAATLKMRVTFETGQDYWMNAIALATVARMGPARQASSKLNALNSPNDHALDVHKSSISACILVQVAGPIQKHQRRFAASSQVGSGNSR